MQLVSRGVSKMARKQVVSFRVPQELEKEIIARGNPSEVIRRDLERLYTLYRRALRRINLTPEEMKLIADSLNGLNGTIMDASTAPMLWAQVEDAIKLDRLDQKWGVNGRELVEKLRELTDIEALAVVDAAERFWTDPDRDAEKTDKYFKT